MSKCFRPCCCHPSAPIKSTEETPEKRKFSYAPLKASNTNNLQTSCVADQPLEKSAHFTSDATSNVRRSGRRKAIQGRHVESADDPKTSIESKKCDDIISSVNTSETNETPSHISAAHSVNAEETRDNSSTLSIINPEQKHPVSTNISKQNTKLHRDNEEIPVAFSLGPSSVSRAAVESKYLNSGSSNDINFSEFSSNNLSATLLVETNTEDAKLPTLKEILKKNISNASMKMKECSVEIPFIGGNLFPEPQAKESGEQLESMNVEQASVSSPDCPAAARLTRHRTKVTKQATQSDIFASTSLDEEDTHDNNVAAVPAKPICKDKFSLKRKANELPNSDLSKKNPHTNSRARIKALLESAAEPLSLSSTSNNIEKKEKIPLKTPRSSNRYKRIRTFDNDSDTDDEPLKKKAATDSSFGVSLNTNQNVQELQLEVPLREKNSEELRLDEFDNRLFEQLGFKTNQPSPDSKSSKPLSLTSSIEDKHDLPDIHSSSQISLSGGNNALGTADPAVSGNLINSQSSDVKISCTIPDNLESCDDDHIPGTAEVLKNVAAEAELIRNLRNKKPNAFPDASVEILPSQETVDLNSTLGSCIDDANSDIVPSSLPVPEDNMNFKLTDKDEVSGTKSSGLSTKTCLSTATKKLFKKCNKSLTKVENILDSQDSSYPSSVPMLDSIATARAKISSNSSGLSASGHHSKQTSLGTGDTTSSNTKSKTDQSSVGLPGGTF